MKIGILNELLENITYGLRFENSHLVPKIEKEGNPFQQDLLLLKWGEVRDSAVEMDIEFSEECFVDRVVFTTGPKTKLVSLSLKKEGKPLYAHTAETGKTITQNPVELEAGVMTKSLTLVIKGDFSDLEIESITVYGALPEEVDLFPTPNQVSWGEKRIPLSAFVSYGGDNEDGLAAGRILAEKFEEITGQTLTCEQIGTQQKSNEQTGTITFIYNGEIPEEGYKLEVAEAGTTVTASDRRGFVCGAECFIKMVQKEGVLTCSIEDKPFTPFRGVHMYLPGEEHFDFTKRLVKYLFSPMGYNTIIMEVGAGLQFESHPEINEAVNDAVEKGEKGIWPPFPHGDVADSKPLNKKVARGLIEYINDYGIDVIPEVQSMGHVPFITHAHPEVAEIAESDKKEKIDTRVEDAKPSDFYPHCYCPSNEKSYEILFDLLDEIIEVFQPKEYIHMGHDEIYQVGVCPVCKDKDPADLPAMDINKIYDYLKKKGYKMMIWADMLQPVTKYQTPPAIDMIPKDILLLDFVWYFHLDKDIEDNLLEKGFEIAIGNLYSSHFGKYEKRIRKEGVKGGEVSIWGRTCEDFIQQEGKFYDFFYTAQMLWSEDYRHELRLVYDRMIAREMPAIREHLKNVKYPSRMEDATREILTENKISFPPVFPVEQQTEVFVGKAYDSLIFCHTQLGGMTRMPWSENVIVGEYMLKFTDGTTETIAIENNDNIGHWNRRHNQPLTHKLYRHNGYTCVYETDGEEFKTEDGRDVTIYTYEYILPEGKVVECVSLKEDPKYDAKILLYRLEGVKKPT